VVLTGTAVSLFALHRAYVLLRSMDAHRPQPPAASASDTQEIRDAIQALAAQVHELQKNPAPAADAAGTLVGPPRPSFNLTRRSQALRMHRRGETAEQIAAALELPRQEVDLLLKVHRIVLSNV
jgi:hypothetical protein